jgi:toxin ParE1/3/4
MRRLILRQLADEDVRRAAEGYAIEAGLDVAQRFVARLQDAYAAIARMPDTGSPRWAHELSIPGLRSKSIKGFPWAAFYVVAEDRVEILRLLHLQSDIPAWMAVDAEA